MSRGTFGARGEFRAPRNFRIAGRGRTTVTGCVNISPQIGHPTAFRSVSKFTGVSFTPGFTAALMAISSR